MADLDTGASPRAADAANFVAGGGEVSNALAVELRECVASDRCTAVIGKPYNAAKLTAALDSLGVSCAAGGKG